MASVLNPWALRAAFLRGLPALVWVGIVSDGLLGSSVEVFKGKGSSVMGGFIVVGGVDGAGIISSGRAR